MFDWNTLINGLNAAALAAFGTEVTYISATGTPTTIPAIVETAKETEDATPGVYAVLFIRLADLNQPPQRGDTVVIGESPYTVFDLDADGGGGVMLRLRQV